MHILIAALTLAAVYAWAVAHQLILYYIGAVLVEQLPPPAPNGSAVYRYFYSVIQILAANLKRTQFTPPKP